MPKRIFLTLLLLPTTVKASADGGMMLNLIAGDQPQGATSLFSDGTSEWRAGLFLDKDVKKKPKFYDLVLHYTRKYDVPSALVLGIIKAESNFNPNAISYKGAKGLMQLMDMNSQHWKIDPFKPEQNIKVGTAMISRLLKKYKGNIDLALAAYNAGEGNVKKYRGIPPYKETQQYIIKVKHNMKLYDAIIPPASFGSFPSLFHN
ncbi:lytic transglycosylase domain-containing protein [Photobacterium sp. SDRW27]|uniref:lytic transglycosylase domain-containing protein n=1 Tax=Photobacterium obscurum TaxID=2829490 RepID=UPI002242ECD2|nr:lytic transglycosylase domain-containing protein [Photobacterium obscurum]MCW8330925.1 lytic transglycosylase domain-containing protein [Photobacterium obscurum]